MLDQRGGRASRAPRCELAVQSKLVDRHNAPGRGGPKSNTWPPPGCTDSTPTRTRPPACTWPAGTSHRLSTNLALPVAQRPPRPPRWPQPRLRRIRAGQVAEIAALLRDGRTAAGRLLRPHRRSARRGLRRDRSVGRRAVAGNRGRRAAAQRRRLNTATAAVTATPTRARRPRPTPHARKMPASNTDSDGRTAPKDVICHPTAYSDRPIRAHTISSRRRAMPAARWARSKIPQG